MGRGTPLIPAVANALTRRMHKGVNTTMDEGQTVVAFHGSQNPDVSGDVTHPPGRNQGFEACIAFTASAQANSYAWESDVYPTLNAQIPNDTSNIQYGIRQAMQVRRLTPAECTRLQGFPDGYLDIDYRGKPAADGNKYKALGNSMAVNVMRWIGDRINEQMG